MSPPRRAIAALALASVLAAAACRPGQDPAAGLLADARAIVGRAVASERTSFGEAARLGAAALEHLDRLERLYPDSPLVPRLAAGAETVGPFTVDQLGAWQRQNQARAEAEEDALACARFVAGGVQAPLHRAEALVAIAKSECALGRGQDAKRTLAEAMAELDLLGDAGQLETAAASVAGGLARCAEHEMLQSLVRTAVGTSEAAALAAQVAAAVAVESAEAARPWVAEATRLAKSGQSGWMRGAVVPALALWAGPDEVRAWLQEVPAGRDRLRARVAAARALVDHDRAEEASRWLDDALREAEVVEERYALSMSLAEIAQALDELDRAGMASRSDQLLAQALEVAMSIDAASSVKDGALAKIARKYAWADRSDMALLIAEAMIPAGPDRAWAQAGVAHAYADRGDFTAALPVVFAIDGTDLRRRALVEVLVRFSVRYPQAGPAERAWLHVVVDELG